MSQTHGSYFDRKKKKGCSRQDIVEVVRKGESGSERVRGERKLWKLRKLQIDKGWKLRLKRWRRKKNRAQSEEGYKEKGIPAVREQGTSIV